MGIAIRGCSCGFDFTSEVKVMAKLHNSRWWELNIGPEDSLLSIIGGRLTDKIAS